MSFIDPIGNFKSLKVDTTKTPQTVQVEEEEDCFAKTSTEQEIKQDEEKSFLNSVFETVESVISFVASGVEKIFNGIKNLFGLNEKAPESVENDVNGEIDQEVKQGQVNDCVLLGTIYSLAQNPKGEEIIKNAITINQDESGNPESYSVYFKGIDETFTISKEELEKADDMYSKFNKDKNIEYTYSVGDDDMLLLELAWEKCFEEASDKLAKIKSNSVNLKIENSKGPEALNSVNGQKLFYALTGSEFSHDYSVLEMYADKQEKENTPKIMEIFNKQNEFKLEEVSFANLSNFYLADGTYFGFNRDDTYEILQKPSESENNEIIVKNKKTDETFSYNALSLARSFSRSLSEENKDIVFDGEYELAIQSDVVTVGVCTGSSFKMDSVDGKSVKIINNHCYGVKDVNEEYITLINPHNTSEEIKIPKEELKKNKEKISFTYGNLD